MGVKITGLNGLAEKLENIALRSSRGSREALERGAKDIKDLSVLHSPVDEGNLEDAHKIEKGKGLRGRNHFTVYIDEDMSASDKEDSAKTVGDYAFEMHDGTYLLGTLSEAKQDEVGVRVGPKYLERAVDELKDGIEKKVEAGALKGIGK